MDKELFAQVEEFFNWLKAVIEKLIGLLKRTDEWKDQNLTEAPAETTLAN